MGATSKSDPADLLPRLERWSAELHEYRLASDQSLERLATVLT